LKFDFTIFQIRLDKVIHTINDAIDFDYRHIDCPHIYGNEKEIDIALQAKIAEGVVKIICSLLANCEIFSIDQI